MKVPILRIKSVLLILLLFFSTDTILFGTNSNKIFLYMPRLIGIFFILALWIIGGRKMENKNLDSYGYLLNCPDEMLGDVNKTMNDKRAIINWNNFNVGDAFYTENIYRCVMVDHVMKRIVFVTEEEYKNEFELRYNNNKHKKPDMRKKIKEYIGELNTEIDKLEDLLKNTDSPYDLQIKGRLNAIIEVKNDLLGRLEEVI